MWHSSSVFYPLIKMSEKQKFMNFHFQSIKELSNSRSNRCVILKIAVSFIIKNLETAMQQICEDKPKLCSCICFQTYRTMELSFGATMNILL